MPFCSFFFNDPTCSRTFRLFRAGLFLTARAASVISLFNALAEVDDPEEQNRAVSALLLALPFALLAVITSLHQNYSNKNNTNEWHRHTVNFLQAGLIALARQAGGYTFIRFLLDLPMEDQLWSSWLKLFLAIMVGATSFGTSIYETRPIPNPNEAKALLSQLHDLVTNSSTISEDTKEELHRNLDQLHKELHRPQSSNTTLTETTHVQGESGKNEPLTKNPLPEEDKRLIDSEQTSLPSYTGPR